MLQVPARVAILARTVCCRAVLEVDAVGLDFATALPRHLEKVIAPIDPDACRLRAGLSTIAIITPNVY